MFLKGNIKACMSIDRLERGKLLVTMKWVFIFVVILNCSFVVLCGDCNHYGFDSSTSSEHSSSSCGGHNGRTSTRSRTHSFTKVKKPRHPPCDDDDDNDSGSTPAPSATTTVRPRATTTSRPSDTTTAKPDNGGNGECSDAYEELLKGLVNFNNRFLYEANKQKPISYIMSPLSVLIPMAQLALYAEKETYDQLISLLNLKTKDEIRCSFPKLLNRLQGSPNVTFTLASRLFATKVHPLTKEFFNDAKNVFGSEPESLDFLDEDGSIKRIDEWVANATNNRIKNIATKPMVGKRARLVLANAIYFLGKWLKPFKNPTEELSFNVNSDTKINIPIMSIRDDFKYQAYSELDCKVLQMFYVGGQYSLVVFLPNKIDGLSALLEKLLKPNALLNAYNNLIKNDVSVLLPKIKTESTFKLADYLRPANVTYLFSNTDCTLNKILEVYEYLYVNEDGAIQKAFVEVNEEGTEATAATVVGGGIGGGGPPPPPKTFYATQPFAFYVFKEEIPLFCGTFTGVTK